MSRSFVCVFVVFNVLYPIGNKVASLLSGYKAFVKLKGFAKTIYHLVAENFGAFGGVVVGLVGVKVGTVLYSSIKVVYDTTLGEDYSEAILL